MELSHKKSLLTVIGLLGAILFVIPTPASATFTYFSGNDSVNGSWNPLTSLLNADYAASGVPANTSMSASTNDPNVGKGLDRACKLMRSDGWASYANGRKYTSPGNNQIASYDGSRWILYSAKTYNGHISELSCSANPAPAPSLSLNRSSITVGQSATLSWNDGPSAAEQGEVCTPTNFSNTVYVPAHTTTNYICAGMFGCFPMTVTVPAAWVAQRSGSVKVSPTITTTYTYACSGAGGSRSVSRTLTVVGAPTASLGNNGPISSGGSATLSYACTNSSSASINQGVGAVTPVASGTRTVSPTVTTTYTLTCTGTGGTATNATQVTVTAAAQCNDATDNDSDGWNNYPADPGCTSLTDTTESPNPQCSDNSDNDGDGTADLSDPGCTSITDTTESPNPQCSNGTDDDGDTRIDMSDTGCTSGSDTSESPDAGPSGTPAAFILATPNRVAVPNAVNLTWSASNVTSCTVTGSNGMASIGVTPVLFQVATGTAVSSGPISGQTKFTITCSPSVSSTAVVNVVPKFEEF